MSSHHCLMRAGLDCGTASGQQHQQKELRLSLVQVVKCPINIHADQHIFWMLDTTRKSSNVYKIMTELMEENSGMKWNENSVQHCNKVKTAIHKGTTLYCTDKSSFGASCRMYQGCLFQLLSQLCSHCKRNAPGFEWNQV